MRYVWEHNGSDTMLYALDYPGAFSRGASLEEALEKLPVEIQGFRRWMGCSCTDFGAPKLAQEVISHLNVRDADSDAIFDTECSAMSLAEYEACRALAMKSARDFQMLFDSVPDPHISCYAERRTFYGDVPRTAAQMYEHTKNVNAYYFGEICVDADNIGTIAECRAAGFRKLEQIYGFLEMPPVVGSYGELWSLRKLFRRFLWHDRIHAKAMYRMAVKTFGTGSVPDIFCIDREGKDFHGMA